MNPNLVPLALLAHRKGEIPCLLKEDDVAHLNILTRAHQEDGLSAFLLRYNTKGNVEMEDQDGYGARNSIAGGSVVQLKIFFGSLKETQLFGSKKKKFY